MLIAKEAHEVFTKADADGWEASAFMSDDAVVVCASQEIAGGLLGMHGEDYATGEHYSIVWQLMPDEMRTLARTLVDLADRIDADN